MTIPQALMSGTAECGKTVTFTATSVGPTGTRATKQVQATIVDGCAACSGGNLDMSAGAYAQLASSGTQTSVSWSFD